MLRVADHHHCEELVQDCLLAAWRQREGYDGRSSLRTWLVGILKHKIVDHHRKAARTPALADMAHCQDDDKEEDPFERVFDANGSWKIDPSAGLGFLNERPDHALERSELMDWISRCITRLPGKMRALFTAREIDDMSVPDAAVACGMSAGTAAVLLTRARLQMRNCLQRSSL